MSQIKLLHSGGNGVILAAPILIQQQIEHLHYQVMQMER